MHYLKSSKLFYVLVIVALSLLVLFQLKDIKLLEKLLVVLGNTLLVPTIVSIFIYYLLKPIYLFLLKKIKKQGISLVITMITFFVVITILINQFLPLLINQVDSFIQTIPALIEELDRLLLSFGIFEVSELNEYLSVINTSFEELASFLFVSILNSTNYILEFLSSSFFVISLVPLFVYYMLKQTGRTKAPVKGIPEKYQTMALTFFTEVEQALANYITGKAIVCFYVFVGAFITFFFAGIPGALLFALVAGIMDVVPYFGPWIGAFPAVLAASILDESNFFIAIVGIIIVQLGESYVVSPLVMSKGLKMHPLMIIVLMLITGQMFGLIGMIVILPVIAVLKICLHYGLMIIRESKKEKTTVEK